MASRNASRHWYTEWFWQTKWQKPAIQRKKKIGSQAVSDRKTGGLQAVSSTGHGWFRTSDLSRVMRYVSSREAACSTCK